MGDIASIGLDLAKQVFQVHAADIDGKTLFNKKLRRSEVIEFFGSLSPCDVAMEACASAYYWAREIGRFGHRVKLVPAQLVKAFVTRGKTDAKDAAAINASGRRSDIQFVAQRSCEQQGCAMLLRTRTLLVRQRTKVILALRGHLAEFGIVAGRGVSNAAKLVSLVRSGDRDLPSSAAFALNELCDEIESLNGRLDRVEKRIAADGKSDEIQQRLLTIPGVGVLTAAAIRAYVTDARQFKNARQFAAWLGLTPLAHSSGGSSRLGRMSKRGNKELRSLLYNCATSSLRVAHKSGRMDRWLESLLQRKPKKVVTVALSNKIARIVWVIMTRGCNYEAAA